MYYYFLDFNIGKYSVGFVWLRDVMWWFKFGKIFEGGGFGLFDEFGIVVRYVVLNFNGSGYFMVYEGIGVNGRISVGMVKFVVGLFNWERC